MKSSLIKLETFLNEHRCNDINNLEPTHMSYGKIQGKFSLDRIQRKEFMKLYYNAIKTGHQLSILEKPKEFGPLVVDIDIKNNSTDNKRLYNDKLINKIIELYTNELNNYIENNEDKHYEFFIFEKNKPTIKDNIKKDGFHIMVPKLCLSFDDKFYIREQVIKQVIEQDLLTGFLESPDKIIDKAVIKSNGWFLYGSTKPERLDDPYKITKVIKYYGTFGSDGSKGQNNKNIYEDITDEITNFKLKDVIKYLSITDVYYKKSNKTLCKEISDTQSTQSFSKETDDNINIYKDRIFDEENNDDLMDKLEFTLKNINCSRAEDYNFWSLCSFILKDLGEDYKTLYINFSRRSNKHKNISLSELNKHWNNIKNNDNKRKATTATLYYWLKEDNPEAFEEMINKYKKVNELTPLEKWYKEQKEIFERNHFRLDSTSEVITEPDKIMDKFIYHSFDKMKNITDDINFKQIEQVGKYTKEITYYFFKMWKEDKNKRKYKHIIFRPQYPPVYEGYYNRFNGFTYDSDIVEFQLNKTVDNVFNHIFSNDTDYIYSWISHIINKPYEKTNHAIVLYSQMLGVGKNTIIELLMKLFNKYFGRMSTIDDVSRNFNTHLCNKLFIYGDEIKPSKNKELSDELKNIITSTMTNEERKGIDVDIIPDYANYIFTTNNELAFNVEPNDRRYYMVECPNIVLDEKIYTEYYSILNNEKEMIKIFSFFKNYKSNKYKNIKQDSVPMTDYKARVIAQKIPAYLHFWYTQIYCPNGCTISATKLYNLIKDYAQSKKLSSSFTPTLFGLEMKKLGFETLRKKSGVVYNIPKLEERKKILQMANPKYYDVLDTENLSDHLEYNYVSDV